MTRHDDDAAGRDLIALVLAVGLCTALNLIVAAILYDAVRNPESAGISENATQILTGWGGGIVGILGAVFGYRAGVTNAATTSAPSLTTNEPDVVAREVDE